jgi:hypothetical protein
LSVGSAGANAEMKLFFTLLIWPPVELGLAAASNTFGKSHAFATCPNILGIQQC